MEHPKDDARRVQKPSFKCYPLAKLCLLNGVQINLPCITTIQFRLIKIENGEGYHLNTLFNARSIDAYQKAGGNFAAIALLTKEVAQRLQEKLKTNIWAGGLDGMITDAHIYQETIDEAQDIIKSYKRYDQNS